MPDFNDPDFMTPPEPENDTHLSPLPGKAGDDANDEAQAQANYLRKELAREVDLQAENVRLREALDTIAGGYTSRFPGAPDVMAVTPEVFRSQMWSWSQKVARSALDSEST